MTQPKTMNQTGTMNQQASEPTSRSAKILYRPVGIVSSIGGGLLANLIFQKVWQRAAPGPDAPPTALQTGHGLKEILLAAALQGAIFATVKVLIDRGGARAFQQWSGEWPGD